jgi:hypothetical protein
METNTAGNPVPTAGRQFQSMIRKSGNRSSLATNAKCACAEIMLKQKDEIMMRFHLIAS